MSDAVDQLAVAAQQYLRNPNASSGEAWFEADWRRRVAALVIDLGAMTLLGFVFGFMTLIAYMLFMGDDFDGGPWSKTTAEWLLRAFAAFFALAYSLLDLFARGTIGKRPWGLRVHIVNDDPDLRVRRLLIRWLIKTTPLLIHFGVCSVAYLVLEVHHRDHEHRDPASFVQAMSIVGVWLPLFLFAIQCAYAVRKRGRAIHDDVVGTIVCQSASREGPRGFEPIILR